MSPCNHFSKYFCEKGNYKIVVAGSLLGTMLSDGKTSFPVGKVHRLMHYPLNFEKFILAIDKKGLHDKIVESYESNKKISDSIHNKLLELYSEYLIIGGMPESINHYNKDRVSCLKQSTITINILNDYISDISKYTNKESVNKINSIYKSIPSQLFKPDNKFKYSIVERNKNKAYFGTSIDWLINASLLYKSQQVSNPIHPLKINIDEDYFKLFMNDIGLLCVNAGVSYNSLVNIGSYFKGYLAESYVAMQLSPNNYSLYYYRRNTSEIDFLVEDTFGNVIPIEVKYSINTKSKSLTEYVKRYNPKYSIRISSKNFGFDNNIKSIPLYAAHLINKLRYNLKKCELIHFISSHFFIIVSIIHY